MHTINTGQCYGNGNVCSVTWCTTLNMYHIVRLLFSPLCSGNTPKCGLKTIYMKQSSLVTLLCMVSVMLSITLSALQPYNSAMKEYKRDE